MAVEGNSARGRPCSGSRRPRWRSRRAPRGCPSRRGRRGERASAPRDPPDGSFRGRAMLGSALRRHKRRIRSALSLTRGSRARPGRSGRSDRPPRASRGGRSIRRHPRGIPARRARPCACGPTPDRQRSTFTSGARATSWASVTVSAFEPPSRSSTARALRAPRRRSHIRRTRSRHVRTRRAPSPERRRGRSDRAEEVTSSASLRTSSPPASRSAADG